MIDFQYVLNYFIAKYISFRIIAGLVIENVASKFFTQGLDKFDYGKKGKKKERKKFNTSS